MTDRRGISIKALALGVATDIAGSAIGAAALGVILGGVLVAQGVPEDELAGRLQGPMVLISGLLIGFGFTMLGGFVAGRVSRTSPVVHGGLVGLVAIVLGLPFWTWSPLWVNVLCLLGLVPFGMLGGYAAGADRRAPSP
jgi:hypothetical protein